MVFASLLVVAVIVVVTQGRVDYEKADPVPPPTYVAHKVAPGAQDSLPEECRVDVYLAWQRKLGAGGLTPPVVADFDQDGRKEAIFSTTDHYIEAVLTKEGHKADGWPLVLPDSIFLASPLVYDVDKSGSLDVVVTTEAGEIVFVDESGIPLYNYTLKISPAPLGAHWFDGLTDSFGEAYWELMRRRDPKSSPARYRHRGLDPVDPSHGEKKDSRLPQLPKGFDATPEGLQSLELFLDTNLPYAYVNGIHQQLNPLYSPTYEELTFDKEREVLVPPHVLATPLIADLDRDGVDELIVPVSYFYTMQQARHFERYNLKAGLNANKFSIAGLVVFDLQTHTLRWQVELGATMNMGEARAFIYGPPVVADLDGEGSNEIVVADGSGHIHVLNARGETVKPWPVRMGPLAASPVVEDVNGDGKLEIVVLDANGNLVCFSAAAEELWAVKIFTGSVPPLDHAPTVGDVNGDGVLDLVFGTPAGYLYAVSAASGKMLPNYPVQFPGPIEAEVALAHVRGLGLHLFFTCHGRFYMVDGIHPSCMDSQALSETGLSTVSIDDFTGDGEMDFLVSTHAGHLFCFASTVPYHPLNTWSTPWSGGTKVATNYAFHGIFAENRGARDISGSSLPLRFTIVDKRKKAGVKKHYDVSININGFSVFNASYASPGTYTAHLPIPSDRQSAAITLWMENEAHQIFTDFFSCSFNVKFYRLLKYVLLMPLTLIMGAVAWAASAAEAKKDLL